MAIDLRDGRPRHRRPGISASRMPTATSLAGGPSARRSAVGSPRDPMDIGDAAGAGLLRRVCMAMMVMFWPERGPAPRLNRPSCLAPSHQRLDARHPPRGEAVPTPGTLRNGEYIGNEDQTISCSRLAADCSAPGQDVGLPFVAHAGEERAFAVGLVIETARGSGAIASTVGLLTSSRRKACELEQRAGTRTKRPLRAGAGTVYGVPKASPSAPRRGAVASAGAAVAPV